jgi:thymidylate synthase (FAD)
MTVKFITDRGVTHELVRHRVASFSQESTRYCNYAKGKFCSQITLIKPAFWYDNDAAYNIWVQAMENAEKYYFELLMSGATAQEARTVLPNSLKAEIIMTANFREWRHIFRLRCSEAAHIQIRDLMIKTLEITKKRIPIIFDDLSFSL